MSVGIKKLEKVYCSLNLGYIYNLSYSFTPSEGVKISLFFVNETGDYDLSFLRIPTYKVQIKIGKTSFNLYPVSVNKSSAFDQKVLKVNFVDETFSLKNYYIALTGRGCGNGVYQLGKTVDTRTDAQKKSEDPDLFKIKEFTTFEDVEYNFNDFIDTLRKVFQVELLTNVDQNITRDYSGTFDSVLSSWCSYLGLSYFFENSVLKIFNPSSLSINFPETPEDAMELEESISIENTYDRTVWNYFKDDGGEVKIGANSSYLIKSLQLYPIDDLFDLRQMQPKIAQNIDLGQLSAAQYGKDVWLLYNIMQGTSASNCGYDITASSPLLDSWKNSLPSDRNYRMAIFDVKKFEENFEFYKTYGNLIQGRLYVSNSVGGIEQFQSFSWYDQGNGQISDVEVLKTKPSPQLKIFKNKEYKGVLEGTEINAIYQGAIANGQRFYYLDQSNRNSEVFKLSDSQAASVAFYMDNYLNGLFGNNGADYGGDIKYITHREIFSFSSDALNLVNSIESNRGYFSYKSKSINLKGLSSISADNEEYNPTNKTDIKILNGSTGIVSNMSTLKAYVDSNLVAYYSKYENCKHVSTNINAFTRQFLPRTISDDIPIIEKYKKDSNGALEINRDFTYFNKVSESNILDKLATSYGNQRKTKSFSLNYFDPNIPINPLTNGLVGIDINIQQNGMTVRYNYSNEAIDVMFSESEIDILNKSIKNSMIRKYMPQKRANSL